MSHGFSLGGSRRDARSARWAHHRLWDIGAPGRRRPATLLYLTAKSPQLIACHIHLGNDGDPRADPRNLHRAPVSSQIESGAALLSVDRRQGRPLRAPRPASVFSSRGVGRPTVYPGISASLPREIQAACSRPSRSGAGRHAAAGTPSNMTMSITRLHPTLDPPRPGSFMAARSMNHRL